MWCSKIGILTTCISIYCTHIHTFNRNASQKHFLVGHQIIILPTKLIKSTFKNKSQKHQNEQFTWIWSKNTVTNFFFFWLGRKASCSNCQQKPCTHTILVLLQKRSFHSFAFSAKPPFLKEYTLNIPHKIHLL